MNADTNRPKMSAPTPETDNLARGNHVVPTEWAEQLERERDEALKYRANGDIATMTINHYERLLRERDEAIRQRNETNESSVFSCNFYYEEKLKAESERDEAREKYTALATENMLAVNKLAEERDEARAVAYDLAVIASHCLGWHDHESSEAAIRIAAALKRWKKSK